MLKSSPYNFKKFLIQELPKSYSFNIIRFTKHSNIHILSVILSE